LCRASAYASVPGSYRTVRRAYLVLHEQGLAHSFEAWQGNELVGGLYGVAIGRVFFGESMFHRVSNASKAAFVYAVETLWAWGYMLIDCQVYTEHLASLGAAEIPRADFVRLLDSYCVEPVAESRGVRPMLAYETDTPVAGHGAGMFLPAERRSRLLFVNPAAGMDESTYSALARVGFRPERQPGLPASLRRMPILPSQSASRD